MPILHVRALPQKNESIISQALKSTTVAVSKVYDCRPEQVWATWEEIQPGRYLEGENEASTQPHGTHPPICELICFEGQTPEKIEQLLKVASSTLSQSLGIQDNIFMTYREAKSGEVIAGNGILRK